MKKFTLAAMTIIAIALFGITPAMACDGDGCDPGYWSPDETSTGWYKSSLDFSQYHVVDLVPSNYGNTTYWGSGSGQALDGKVASGGGISADIGVQLDTSHQRDAIAIKDGTGYSSKDMVALGQAGTDDTPGKDKAGFKLDANLDQEMVAFKEAGPGWYKVGGDGKQVGSVCAKVYADKGSYASLDLAGLETIGYTRDSGPITENVSAFTAYRGNLAVGTPPSN